MPPVNDNQRRAVGSLGCSLAVTTVLGMAAVSVAAKEGAGFVVVATLIGMWVLSALVMGTLGLEVLRPGAALAPRAETPVGAPDGVPATLGDAVSDARDALVSLGFPRRRAEEAVAQARRALGQNATAEATVRAALLLLSA